MTTQVAKLRRRYRELQDGGVLDMKFSFAPLAEETDESVCGSINEALDAIERGEYDEQTFVGDSRRSRIATS